MNDTEVPKGSEQKENPPKAPSVEEQQEKRKEAEPVVPESLEGWLDKFNLKAKFGELLEKISSFLKNFRNGLEGIGNKQEKQVTSAEEKEQEKDEKPKEEPNKPAEAKESKETITAKEVFCFGDSLTDGLVNEADFLKIDQATQSGIGSGKLVQRLHLLRKAKEAGAKKCVLSFGLNDGVPNQNNADKILKEAIALFGADNVYYGLPHNYAEDGKYAKNYKNNPKLADQIESYNASIKAKYPNIHTFDWETKGKLHPTSYAPVAQKLKEKLNVTG